MIPRLPRDVGLPYPHWHEGQEQALQWLEDNWQQFHVLFLDAPTATGKSGVAYTVPKLTDSDGYWATWSKKLQDQGATLGVPSIKGRSNFPCKEGLDEGLDSCEFKVCDDDDPANEEPGRLALKCPFIQQFKTGANAPLTVLNYALLLQYLYHPKRPLPWRPWLIADEGDVLEDALAGYLDVTLDRIYLERIEFPVELPSDGRDLDKLMHWAEKARAPDVMDGVFDTRQRHAWRLVQDLAERTKSAIESEYILDDRDMVITLRVLWPLRHMKVLLNRFRHLLIMSATLGDIKAMAKEMVLGDSEWTSLAVPSAIPVDRRLIYYAPVANLKHEATALDYERMADAIIKWGKEDYPRSRGLVHVSSYNHARRLGQLLFARGLGYRVHIQDRPGPKPQAAWEASPDGVLVSPVAGLGLDLPYVFPWQVVAKLPYPGLGDKIVRMRLHDNPAWYDRKTSHKTVQMAGRVTRTPTDEGITIITDSSFKKLYHRSRSSFPQWFADALRWEGQY